MSLKISFLIGLLHICINPLALADNHRVYDAVMLQTGKQLFQTHCAACHGQNAEGTVQNWQQPDANGKYPPPPLNGTAHTWHHRIGGLVNTVKNGTLSIGGSMPPWKETLSDEEIFSIIIWLSSLWPEEIYDAWLQRNEN